VSALSYRDIQNSVIAQGFDETDRAQVKIAIQFRHAWLWDLEDWTFRYKFSTVTFTEGSRIATAPEDLNAVVALYDAQGGVVRGVKDRRSFFNVANSALVTGTGSPGLYTMVAGQLYTDMLGDGSTGELLYRRSKPVLLNDADTTGLPADYDLALVHGGKAEMFKLKIVPDLAADFDNDFTAAANALRRNYLEEVLEQGQQWGAFRPGLC
jgi:hypothetical protein